MSTSRAIVATSVDASIYHRFMDAGFRRSGLMLYQPVCIGCRECQQIRVPTHSFMPSKAQRRSIRRNADLKVEVIEPTPTREKFELYQRYVMNWHRHEKPSTWEEYSDFLYQYPSTSIEFIYRLEGAVIAAGLCDVCEVSLSSVYFYFEPQWSSRSLGTFGALVEIDWAASHNIPHYYLGYLVRDCSAMSYKTNFRPYELLGMDGTWRSGH
jgi:arginine-tRNA-protein transferase